VPGVNVEDKLRDAFVGRGLLSEDRFRGLLEAAWESGRPLDRVLVEEEALTEVEILCAFAEALDMPFLDRLVGVTVPEEFIERVPLHFARRNNCVAIGCESGRLTVATSSPLELQFVDDLAALFGTEVEPVLASSVQILALVDCAYESRDRLTGIVDDVMEEISNGGPGLSVSEPAGPEDLLDVGDRAPVVQLVRQVLYDAVQMRASDVHIQPREGDVCVRYRVDGILYDRLAFPKALQEAVVSRIKVMGYMDIAEKRLPQDGRTTMTIRDREIDLRISCVPTCYGERVVLRLLDKSARLLSLDEVGLSGHDMRKVGAMVAAPHGVVFLTGPTGCGKTTSLYAILNRINSPEKNIITIEDPIEYRLRGVSQTQVSGQKGLTFASGLRSVLRQDPDIIMVGEVRDLETARMAIQSALTGHLVFSTLHTNDSAGALTRLLDIGIEPYLVSSAVVGAIAQRLVRLICPSCKTPCEPDEEMLRALGVPAGRPRVGTLYCGRGCDECMGTGYYGRTGVYEVLPIDEPVRAQIMGRCSAGEIKAGALRRGLSTLRMDAARKALAGRTTVEEALRVTQVDAASVAAVSA
jgi:general secretion pathway protein E